MGKKKTTGRRKTASRATRKKSDSSQSKSKEVGRRFCSQPPEIPMRTLDPGLPPGRVQAILPNASKWVNGTKLKYFFFDQQSDGQQVILSNGTRQWRSWVGNAAELHAVLDSYDLCKAIGIGLEFEETDDRNEADVRIGFMKGDGSWSYLGRQVRQIGVSDRTMNFGWDIVSDPDTAVHEIGHTLGLAHEHQNPTAGIVWDEDAVYRELGGPPNNWDRNKTYHNIIRKIAPDEVQGSSWDPDSVMHYPFRSKLITAPAPYNSQGVAPPGGLSDRDKSWVLKFYPPLTPQRDPKLVPFESQRLALGQGEQANFVIEPLASRTYNIQTFGQSDTVMVLFEDVGGTLEYVAGDDDSGQDHNALIQQRLRKSSRYILRIRLYWSRAIGETAVLLW